MYIIQLTLNHVYMGCPASYSTSTKRPTESRLKCVCACDRMEIIELKYILHSSPSLKCVNEQFVQHTSSERRHMRMSVRRNASSTWWLLCESMDRACSVHAESTRRKRVTSQNSGPCTTSPTKPPRQHMCSVLYKCRPQQRFAINQVAEKFVTIIFVVFRASVQHNVVREVGNVTSCTS